MNPDPAFSDERPAIADGDPLRVLVVEDDPVTGRIAVQMLAELSAIADLATTAEDGLAHLLHTRYDLVLVDIGLPGASGTDLVHASITRFPTLPHVILSSRSDANDVIEAMRHGAEDYIVKPLTREALGCAITRATARPRLATTRTPERVLAIGAHPDDVEIGVGGTLHRHTADGDDVTILTLTGGEQGGDASWRVQEARRAAEILGARLVIDSLADTMISAGPPTIDVIARAVELYRPTIIYTHTDNDVHQDHRGVHAATMIAARRVPRIYAYQAPSTSIEFRPTRFVRIDDHFDAKLAAIAAHATQASRAYLEPDLLHATARYWGRYASGGLVEPLEVARHTDIADRPGEIADADPALLAAVAS